jgi:hypothetical protein
MVPDWMILSREIELYRSNWRDGKRAPRRASIVGSLASRGF